MAVLVETERIILRHWNPELEAEHAFELYSDPEVMRYIGKGQTVTSLSDIRNNLRHRLDESQRRNDGSGAWAIVDRATQEPVGTALLKRLPDGDGVPTLDWEVGWHLKKSAWGKGYATEAGNAVLNYGFTTLQLPVIYAVVIPENQASIRVTQRLGMQPLGRTNRYYGVEVELFELRNPHG